MLSAIETWSPWSTPRRFKTGFGSQYPGRGKLFRPSESPNQGVPSEERSSDNGNVSGCVAIGVVTFGRTCPTM